MEEQFYTYEVFYTGNIERELDEKIEEVIREYLSETLNVQSEWYYSEFTLTIPSYRLIGFELSRELVHIERLKLIQYVADYFSGLVLTQ
jgi:hypothetical protein